MHTYTLVSGTGDADNASFKIEGSNLKINAAPDFETQSSYSIRVQTVDDDDQIFSKSFILDVNNLIDEIPSDISISATSFEEN